MSHERKVLSAVIKSREAFDAIERFVDREDFTEQGRLVWSRIEEYYDRDPQAGGCDPDILAEAVCRNLAADKHKDLFKRLVHSLGESEVSPANVVENLLSTRQERIGQQLAAAILAGEDTERLLYDYTEILAAKTIDSDSTEEEERCGFSVEKLVATDFDKDNLVTLYPSGLNERVGGGAKPGHHIIIYARPEMGKTMLVIENLAGFARDHRTCLYIGNEDPIADINMRLVNRLSGMTKEQVVQDPKRADALARANGYENIVLKGMAPGSPREITQLMEKLRPDVLVLDQLRNLNMSQDNYVLALEQAAKQARQWAKRYSCVVVSVTQAGDSAEGKAVLNMGDVDFSNTGIPAACDLMIAMGANKDHIANGERVLNLPKNKLSGVHDFFPVQVEPHLSKVLSF